MSINIQEKLCTTLVLFTRLYKDAWSTKHKKQQSYIYNEGDFLDK